MEKIELERFLRDYKLQKKLDTQNDIYPIDIENLKSLIDTIPSELINEDINGGNLRTYYHMLSESYKDESDELYEVYLGVKFTLDPKSLLICYAPEYGLSGIGNLDINDFSFADDIGRLISFNNKEVNQYLNIYKDGFNQNNPNYYPIDTPTKAQRLYLNKEQPIRSESKIGRNEPCPCGSGIKYKKCCI